MDIRGKIRLFFNLMMTILLWSSCYCFYLYVCPWLSEGGVSPEIHGHFYHYTVGALLGFGWMLLSITMILLVVLFSSILIYLILTIFNGIFDSILPEKRFTEEEIRDIKLEEALEKNPIRKIFNKMKRLW